VDIQGGYRGLVEVIGAMPGRSEMHVRDLVRLLRRITVRWQAADRTGELPLLVGFDDRTAVETRHRSAVLTLWLSPLMIPGKVVLPKGWRTLVPVLDLPALGAVSRNLWAAAGRLDLLALIRLAKRSPELVTHGGVHLDWESLAVEAGLNPARLPPLLDYWRHDGDDHEARWVIVGDDRWTLADRSSTRSAIRFLLEGARDRIRGREAGVASAIRKKALLKR
jgi:hypothetical protein